MVNDRRRREFDERIQGEGQKLQDVEHVVHLFVSKTDVWNQKIFQELLTSREENQAILEESRLAREENRLILEESRLAREENQLILEEGRQSREENRKTQERLTLALNNAQEQLVYNQEHMFDLINQTTTVEFEYKFQHIFMFMYDYWFNATTMGDKTFGSWSFGQSPGAFLGSLGGIVFGIFGKFPDDRLGSMVAKAHGFSLNLCQKVNETSFIKLSSFFLNSNHFLLFLN